MNRVLTAKQMKVLEARSDELGVSYSRLMDNAGSAAAALIRRTTDVLNKNCMIFCGRGNNGGDGFVVARKLQEYGANVIVVLADGLPKTEISYQMYDQARRLDLTFFDYETDEVSVHKYLSTADIVVDALFGTGFHGELSEKFRSVCRQINNAVAAVVALDFPSGVDTDTGHVAEGAVRADFTVAFDSLKPSHLLASSRQQCGKVVAVDIGIPSQAREDMSFRCMVSEPEMVFSAIKKRPGDAHKGTFGKLLMLCGSASFRGAASLATGGALRSGAGLVTLASVEPVIQAVAARYAEPVYLSLPASEEGMLSRMAIPEILDHLEKASACLIGCGLGRSEDTQALVWSVIRSAKCPLLIDADGINLVAENIDILLEAQCPVVITPHMGEFARLTGMTVQEIRENRLEIAADFSKRYGVILVLKDSTTLIASPSGNLYFNTTGNPGLSRGGSGDTLAGIISGLLAQSINPVGCGVCGVYLHGLAADRCAARLSQYGMLPSDLLTDLCQIFLENDR